MHVAMLMQDGGVMIEGAVPTVVYKPKEVHIVPTLRNGLHDAHNVTKTITQIRKERSTVVVATECLFNEKEIREFLRALRGKSDKDISWFTKALDFSEADKSVYVACLIKSLRNMEQRGAVAEVYPIDASRNGTALYAFKETVLQLKELHAMREGADSLTERIGYAIMAFNLVQDANKSRERIIFTNLNWVANSVSLPVVAEIGSMHLIPIEGTRIGHISANSITIHDKSSGYLGLDSLYVNAYLAAANIRIGLSTESPMNKRTMREWHLAMAKYELLIDINNIEQVTQTTDTMHRKELNEVYTLEQAEALYNKLENMLHRIRRR